LYFDLRILGAEVVPLQSLGVVDVSANNIEDNEILAHALSNVSQCDRAEGWAIKHSSDFVNEYLRLTAEVLCHGRDVHPTWVTFTMTGTLRSLNCGSV
jgi:hypothetical protein